MNVKIRKLHADAQIPAYATAGAAGFDLVAVEDVIVYPQETVAIPTGLAVELPPEYELQLRPRSGISLKTWLRMANPPATIDSDFRGEVKVLIDNMASESNMADTRFQLVDGTVIDASDGELYECGTYLIRKGDRICQGVIAPIIRAEFTVTDELSETVRGDGGFGSTGV